MSGASSTPKPATTPDVAPETDPLLAPPPESDRSTAPAAVEDAAGGSRHRTPEAEAQAYRKRAQEAEEARDGAFSMLTEVRREIIEGVVSKEQLPVPESEGYTFGLRHTDDLWTVLGARPDDFFDDEGTLDRDGLTAYVLEHTVDRPYLRGEPVAPPRQPGPPRYRYDEMIPGDPGYGAGSSTGASSPMQKALRP